MTIPYLLTILSFATAQVVFGIMLWRRTQTIYINFDVADLVKWLNDNTQERTTHLLDVMAEEIHKSVIEDGKLTRKDLQEVKARLADDEKADQAARRKARAKKAKA